MRDATLTMPDSIPPFDELPELTLSLRSFGSRRRLPNGQRVLEDEEARFFAPMLDARRAAATAVTRVQVVAAFDARRLGALLDATIRAFAAERFQTRPPARRALEAELFELAEPLRVALRELRELAESVGAAREPAHEYEVWMRWLEQLRATFRAADAIWPPLGNILAASPAVDARKRRREEHR
jgi:hypothetical protein